MTKFDRFAMVAMAASMLICVGMAWANGGGATTAESISDADAAQLRGGGCSTSFTSQDPIQQCTATAAACDTFEIFSTGSGSEGRDKNYCGGLAPQKFTCSDEWSQPKDCAE